MSSRRRIQDVDAIEPKCAVRCAIYTRKSTDEGLDQEFNSLDAQRESAEAFIASQKSAGWTSLAERYDDGGYSGGSMERPALDRLLRDIAQGKIDCVVVYKVDRLSRSLMDFARIMQSFDAKGVSFVSVTQQFNTTSSMGRLTLNVLLSFAQFEREIIGERIRDKIGAQKRKGKWAGGVPVLGYDVDRSNPSPRLVVNSVEAARVRQIYQMYLDRGSLLPVVSELAAKGWKNKSRIMKSGKAFVGRAFDKGALYQTLTNPIYVGKIVHKSEAYQGEHEAIIAADLFDRVQALLKSNGRGGGAHVRNKYGALLRGVLRCKACGYAMTHTFTGGRKGRAYRYYRCVTAIKSGAAVCPSGTIPAQQIERHVVEEIRGLSNDRELLEQVWREAQSSVNTETAEFTRERAALRKTVAGHHRSLHACISIGSTPGNRARMAELNERIADCEQRLAQVEAKLQELTKVTISRTEAEAAFADFDALWGSLIPREQTRLLRLLVSTVEYDASAGTLAVTFRPTCIRALAELRLVEAA